MASILKDVGQGVSLKNMIMQWNMLTFNIFRNKMFSNDLIITILYFTLFYRESYKNNSVLFRSWKLKGYGYNVQILYGPERYLCHYVR